MKKKRITFIIAVSSISLVGLVFMQINWILHSANLKETQLNHRLTLASYRLYNKLAHDSVITRSLTALLIKNNGRELILPLSQAYQARIDSLIKNEFRYNHIQLAYKFKVIDKRHRDFSSTCSTSSNAHGLCMEGMLSDQKAELRITFLNKNQYVYASMGGMLLASMLFIALVISCFVITLQTIWKQKKLSEMTSDFINNMTHELKTPISTVALASNMLKKDQVLLNRDKIIHYSTIINDENKKLQDQVEQVLRIAKLEKGDIQLNKVQLNIHDVIRSAINTIDLQVKSRGGKIRCFMNAFKDTVAADVTHITNVISNLLDNANKYSQERPLITVSTYNNDDGVVISVEDKGIGMDKDKQKLIFNKFYRVPTGNIHNVKGYGLGLAYVKMMVDAHKGNIQLQSEIGKGSRFDIFLPFT